MNVLHILSAPAAGGAEIYVKDLINISREHGVNAKLLFISSAGSYGRCLNFENKFLKELDENQIEYFFLPDGSQRKLFAGLSTFNKIIKHTSPDIVHSHLLTGIVYSAFCLYKFKVVYTHHNTVLGINKYAFKLLMYFSDSFIGISEKCKSYLSKYTPKTKDVTAIFNAIDPNRIQPKDKYLIKEEVGLLAVGRIQEQKNYPLMIQALAKAKKSTEVPFKLSIAGEGDLLIKNELLDLIEKLDLSENVVLLGNRSDIPLLMNQSCLFLMSSSWEGLPIALIEAVSSGLPAIVTNVGGCNEIIEEVGGGKLVNPNSIDEYAQALVHLLNNPYLRENYSQQCLINSTKFNIVNALLDHKKVYEKVSDLA